TDTNWTAVAAGVMHSVALKSDGTLWAWGDNSYGELGDTTTANQSSPEQIALPGSLTTDAVNHEWAATAAGNYFTIALKSDGTLWAWGYNANGRLGIGTWDYNAHSSPVQVGTDANWTAAAAGDSHVLALKSDGTLWAWGWNGDGQLGDGRNGDQYSPE